MKFPEGWRGLAKNPFCGVGMDIFWNTHVAMILTGAWKPPKSTPLKMTRTVVKLSNVEYTISLAQGNYGKNMAFLLPSGLC